MLYRVRLRPVVRRGLVLPLALPRPRVLRWLRRNTVRWYRIVFSWEASRRAPAKLSSHSSSQPTAMSRPRKLSQIALACQRDMASSPLKQRKRRSGFNRRFVIDCSRPSMINMIEIFVFVSLTCFSFSFRPNALF